MFHPMALTVVTALIAAMILSLTFVPAAIAFFLSGKVKETESPVMAWAKKAYVPILTATMKQSRAHRDDCCRYCHIVRFADDACRQ
jgi:Cu/Ag efflux pump CusA